MGVVPQLLAGCAGFEDLRAQSLADATAHCSSQKKQFAWHSTDEAPGLLSDRVTVNGRCVGPGEHGYVASNG